MRARDTVGRGHWLRRAAAPRLPPLQAVQRGSKGALQAAPGGAVSAFEAGQQDPGRLRPIPAFRRNPCAFGCRGAPQFLLQEEAR